MKNKQVSPKSAGKIFAGVPAIKPNFIKKL